MDFKRTLAGYYYSFFDSVQKISAMKTRIRQFKKKSRKDALTPEQERQVKEFYAPYKTPSLVFHRYFTEKVGNGGTENGFCVNYIPQDLYVGYIDPFFNEIRGTDYIENKCYFSNLFHGVQQPDTIVKRVNGFWLDGNDCMINEAQLRELIGNEQEGVFLKEAQASAGGHGVTFFDKDLDKAEEILKAAEKCSVDLLVQRGLRQHESLAALNSSSVNSLRLYSVIRPTGEVKIYSSVLRMGVGNIKVDNYASGGIACGIASDGKLRKYAYDKKGNKFEEHPVSHVKLEDYVIPSYEKAVELVKKVHPMIAHYRSVSWDIAINEAGDPVLIEGNFCRGGIDLLQLCNGPLYGDDTIDILNEVFGKK